MSVLLTFMATLLSLLMPWPMKLLLDSVLGDHPLPSPLDMLAGAFLSNRIQLMIAIVLLWLLLGLVISVVSVVTEYVHTKINQNMMLDIRSDLFQHAQRQSLAFHDRQRAGDLLFTVNAQADAAADLALSIQPFVQNGLTLVGMFTISYYIDAQLALISLVVVPVLYYAVHRYTKHIEPWVRKVKKMEGESLAIIVEAMSMIRVIVAFGRETYEHLRFRKHGEKSVDARIKLTTRQSLFGVSVGMTTKVGEALVLGFGAYRVLTNELTLGQLIVVLTYLGSVYGPLQSISHAIGAFQDRFAAMQIAFGLLDTDPEIKDKPDAITIDRAQGHVKFENVNFSYTDRVDTLSDITFEVLPRQVIGIVGPTGAGKTTLVSLLPRFYDVKRGRIFLDGRDIRDLTLQSLRQQIAVVLQDPLLFSGTIFDNINYGRLDANNEEIVEAAKAANAHDFIMALPHRYETRIGERGAQLSGGERQRISIARAFLKDAPLMILDEPTSSIDSKTEAVILDALDRLMGGRTTFMIAHRLATIRRVDFILVIQDGRIVERGTCDELLLRNGLYKELVDLQSTQLASGVHS